MANKLHRDLTVVDGIHIVHAFEYADATARLAAAGFVAADIGKVAQQQDNNSYWVLAAIGPIVWTEITATSVQTTLIFQEGGTAGPNTYTTWAALYAAHQAIPGPKIIVFDPTVTSPMVIPAGSYNMADTTWMGLSTLGTTATQVTINDGVIITDLKEMTRSLLVTSISTGDVFRFTATIPFFKISDSAQLRRTGTAPAIDLSLVASQFWIKMVDRATIPLLGTEVVDVPVGKILIIDMFLASTLSNNSVSGAGILATIRDAGCTVGTQANHTGTLFDLPSDNSLNVAYAPAVLANWSGVSPVNVKAALDRIAAAIGPIP